MLKALLRLVPSDTFKELAVNFQSKYNPSVSTLIHSIVNLIRRADAQQFALAVNVLVHLSFHFEGARQLGALGISSEIIGMLNYGTLSGTPAVTHHWAAIIATNVASVVGLEEFQGIFFAQPSQNLLAENCLPSITDSLDILPNFQDDPLVFISFPATCSRLDVVKSC